MSIWMNFDFVLQKRLVEFINVICSDINLSIIFFWIKVFEFKKMNFNLIFTKQQIIPVVGNFAKFQFVNVKFLRCDFVTHW